VTEALSIGEVAQRSGVPATTLRFYEQIGLLPPVAREHGHRRYGDDTLMRLEVIGACKVAGFTLDEIQVLYRDDEPGRPVSRALGVAKLAEIDAQLAALAHARAIIEWGLLCTCPSIDRCTCGIHPAPRPELPDVGLEATAI
jgi:DNA-binding transcriptional MerR regulator